MPALRHIAAVSAAALALLAAGCGGKAEGLLTASQADELQTKIDGIERSLDENSCKTLADRANDGVELASEPRKLDEDLRSNIIDGFNRLAKQGTEECLGAEEPEATPTPTPEETATEEPTEAPTEIVPTEVPTEAPTEAPTEPPVEIPTPAPTSDEGGGAGVPADPENSGGA